MEEVNDIVALIRKKQASIKIFQILKEKENLNDLFSFF